VKPGHIRVLPRLQFAIIERHAVDNYETNRRPPSLCLSTRLGYEAIRFPCRRGGRYNPAAAGRSHANPRMESQVLRFSSNELTSQGVLPRLEVDL